MHKKYIAISAATVLVSMIPLSGALAQMRPQDDRPSLPPPQMQGNLRVRGDEDFDGPPRDGEIEMHASSTMRFGPGRPGSTTPPWMRGDKKGLIKHSGTTTPPGHMDDRMRGPHMGSTTKATSSPDHENPGMFHSFWRWLWGLPASTTVGQIRAEATASTTASTTPHDAPGFFARIFSFFHL